MPVDIFGFDLTTESADPCSHSKLEIYKITGVDSWSQCRYQNLKTQIFSIGVKFLIQF